MIAQISRLFLFGCTGLVVAAVLSNTAVLADEPSGYFYSYFDQQRPLGLDCQRIAVQAPAGLATVTERLAAHGVDASTVMPATTPGWVTVETPAGARDAHAVESFVATLANSADVAFVSPVFLDSRGEPLLITPDMQVGFHDGVAPATAARILSERGAGVITERDFAGLAGVYRLHTDAKNGFDVLNLANDLARLPEVKFAESDMIIRARLALLPNDPRFAEQWALNQANDQDMDAPEAWDVTTGDDSIIVVVMDSGVQQNHPDLHQIPGQDFTDHGTPGGGPYNECDQHATCVSGCVSAVINNGIGVVGVAPDCVVASAKIGTGISFLGLFCLPFIESQPSYVANALSWAVTSGARVTNSSFGYEESATLTTAYNNAYNNGVINIAATGNDGTSTISYPASLGSVVGVGALNSSGSKASFGSYGTGIAFSAPGEGILTTDQTGSDGYESGDYTTVDGTSFSSPYAAGVAALVLSQAPELTPAEVEQVMSETCVDLGTAGYDTTYGWGFINAYNAVLAVTSSHPLGDLNCDGVLNSFDIDPFVLALTDPVGYEAAYPACDRMLADCNDDGDVNSFDIDPFVNLLTGA